MTIVLSSGFRQPPDQYRVLPVAGCRKCRMKSECTRATSAAIVKITNIRVYAASVGSWERAPARRRAQVPAQVSGSAQPDV